jgi:hypothetical protein
MQGQEPHEPFDENFAERIAPLVAKHLYTSRHSIVHDSEGEEYIRVPKKEWDDVKILLALSKWFCGGVFVFFIAVAWGGIADHFQNQQNVKDIADVKADVKQTKAEVEEVPEKLDHNRALIEDDFRKWFKQAQIRTPKDDGEPQ